MLTFLITNKIVVLLLLETKIDETFLLEQFLISGFAKPLRLDRNSRGGSITFSLEIIFLQGCQNLETFHPTPKPSVPILKLLKACMNSAIDIICTIYDINLPVIKIRKNHHVLILF